MPTPNGKPTVYTRLRWRLRRLVPYRLTDDQDALLRAVLLHSDLTGYPPSTLLPGIADRLDAFPADRALVAYILR